MLRTRRIMAKLSDPCDERGKKLIRGFRGAILIPIWAFTFAGLAGGSLGPQQHPPPVRPPVASALPPKMPLGGLGCAPSYNFSRERFAGGKGLGRAGENPPLNRTSPELAFRSPAWPPSGPRTPYCNNIHACFRRR